MTRLTMVDVSLESENVTKADIVEIIGQYLLSFEHIETGKNLDGKM